MGGGDEEEVAVVCGEVQRLFEGGVGLDAVEVAFDAWGLVEAGAIFED